MWYLVTARVLYVFASARVLGPSLSIERIIMRRSSRLAQVADAQRAHASGDRQPDDPNMQQYCARVAGQQRAQLCAKHCSPPSWYHPGHNWCFSRRVLNVLTVPVCREHGEKRLKAVINAEVQLNAYGRLSVKTKMKL